MEVVISHFGLKRRIEERDAALDVRIIDALEEVRLDSQPTLSELRIRVGQTYSLEQFKARVQWLAEQDLVEVSATGHLGSFRVKLTLEGQRWAREFELQRQAQG